MTGFSLRRTPLHGWFSQLAVMNHFQSLHCSLHWLRVPERIPAGGASVSLSPRLYTRLSGVRSPARLWPQRTSMTALFKYVSHRRSTHPACYHRRPCLPGRSASVWNSLPRTQFGHRHLIGSYCSIIQLFWLELSSPHCALTILMAYDFSFTFSFNSFITWQKEHLKINITRLK